MGRGRAQALDVYIMALEVTIILMFGIDIKENVALGGCLSQCVIGSGLGRMEAAERVPRVFSRNRAGHSCCSHRLTAHFCHLGRQDEQQHSAERQLRCI